MDSKKNKLKIACSLLDAQYKADPVWQEHVKGIGSGRKGATYFICVWLTKSFPKTFTSPKSFEGFAVEYRFKPRVFT
jgi:hypothetical protein